MSSGKVQFEEDQFGLFTDKTTGKSNPVRRFTWKNSSNVTVQVITYGATITSIKIPDKKGNIDDVVLGFDDMEGYLNPLNPYFGATIGRVANRIGYGKITINGIQYKVSSNLGEHTLHGGFRGFDKVNWNYYVDGTKVIMSYLSVDNEEGFPGDLIVNATFELTADNSFLVDFKATTTKPTYVNLTNHSYFNLAGHNKGAQELYKHVVSINADHTTEVDENSIPSGRLLPVEGTIYDLQIPRVLGDVMPKVPDQDGYDHNFCVNKGLEQEMCFIAKAVHPNTGRVLEVYSNQPGVQFYTTNHLADKPELIGKGTQYRKHAAFCFETQNYPDAMNHANFPKAQLNPSEVYHHAVVYKFWIKS